MLMCIEMGQFPAFPEAQSQALHHRQSTAERHHQHGGADVPQRGRERGGRGRGRVASSEEREGTQGVQENQSHWGELRGPLLAIHDHALGANLGLKRTQW